MAEENGEARKKGGNHLELQHLALTEQIAYIFVSSFCFFLLCFFVLWFSRANHRSIW